MGQPARRLATFEDLLDLPETVGGEVIDGQVITSPRPRSRHSRTSGTLSWGLGGQFDFGDGPGGWWFAVEPLVELGPHQLLSPDLAAWRREQMPVFPDEVPLRRVPDWVCEILSPTTARLDRTRKADLYVAGGVGWMWLVDLDARTIEVWEAREGSWVRRGAFGPGDPVRIPPFDAIEVSVDRLLG